ncbi:spidroin-2-like [Gigantopelta aegis]|uniref:spidroin-2-like n=1 Tax=Gigantopelta aegis TaxID=1735272 RepID=UPI001B8883C2|nr:spidroin-2-like [Gigantopelta aegis]
MVPAVAPPWLGPTSIVGKTVPFRFFPLIAASTSHVLLLRATAQGPAMAVSTLIGLRLVPYCPAGPGRGPQSGGVRARTGAPRGQPGEEGGRQGEPGRGHTSWGEDGPGRGQQCGVHKPGKTVRRPHVRAPPLRLVYKPWWKKTGPGRPDRAGADKPGGIGPACSPPPGGGATSRGEDGPGSVPPVRGAKPGGRIVSRQGPVQCGGPQAGGSGARAVSIQAGPQPALDWPGRGALQSAGPKPGVIRGPAGAQQFAGPTSGLLKTVPAVALPGLKATSLL